MSDPMAINRVPVALAGRSYDVVIGQDLIANMAPYLAPFCLRRRVALVTDENVARLHLPQVKAGLIEAGMNVDVIGLPPGEATKSFHHLEALVEQLIAFKLERGDLIIALGGGVIGDLTGFAAAIVKRGLDFVQVPTTLLAQVDSSVGGKTAINSRAGKNLIGAFHQPRLVLADLDVLTTLPLREVMAGYAEIVKCALIGDAPFFEDLHQHAQHLIAGDLEVRATAITRAIRMKAEIVAQDERESGPRALLNLGHTFGHAYEALCQYDSRLLHGEAVALGLNLAFGFSCHLGLCSTQDAQKVKHHLQALGFNIDPARVPGGPYDLDAVMTAMAQDKKIEGGRLTFILAHGIGRCFIAKDVSADKVRAYLGAPI